MDVVLLENIKNLGQIGDVVDVIVNDDDFTSIDIHQIRDLMLAEKALEINKNINN